MVRRYFYIMKPISFVGVMLNTFIEAADDIISGKQVSQRLRLNSAHDFNVGALMMVSRVRSNHSIPEYGSVFSLDLLKSRHGGYSVLVCNLIL